MQRFVLLKKIIEFFVQQPEILLLFSPIFTAGLFVLQLYPLLPVRAEQLDLGGRDADQRRDASRPNIALRFHGAVRWRTTSR